MAELFYDLTIQGHGLVSLDVLMDLHRDGQISPDVFKAQISTGGKTRVAAEARQGDLAASYPDCAIIPFMDEQASAYFPNYKISPASHHTVTADRMCLGCLFTPFFFVSFLAVRMLDVVTNARPGHEERAAKMDVYLNPQRWFTNGIDSMKGPAHDEMYNTLQKCFSSAKATDSRSYCPHSVLARIQNFCEHLTKVAYLFLSCSADLSDRGALADFYREHLKGHLGLACNQMDALLGDHIQHRFGGLVREENREMRLPQSEIPGRFLNRVEKARQDAAKEESRRRREDLLDRRDASETDGESSSVEDGSDKKDKNKVGRKSDDKRPRRDRRGPRGRGRIRR